MGKRIASAGRAVERVCLTSQLHERAFTTMAHKTGQTKPKRLSKGQRKHVRRQKQAARKAGLAPLSNVGKG
jgi:hypothetical protein